MNELSAAVGLAQAERITPLVRRRQRTAALYLQALEGCDWIHPQVVREGVEHTYWTFTVRYEGEERFGASWRSFYELYKKNGGDGFYGGLSVPYLEPIMCNSEFLVRHLGKEVADRYGPGLCPVAESVQPKMMQFKTNYRDQADAERAAAALASTIREVQG
jgi:perosamine synthetase